MTVTPVVAALATLCASTALAGVIEGIRWLGYAGIAIVVVTATGLGLRAVRAPIVVVGLAQMFAVLSLLIALFTNSGIAGMLPGPAALSELTEVLHRSVEVVRTGVPPVDATAAVLCLVVLAIGLVSVLVDTLAVAAGTPAACGLVLLCVYAVPASLAIDMLPWWSFVLGAGSFAMLLAVDGAHRHQQWRNRPELPGTRVGVGSPAAQVSVALVVALLAGATFTAIGTVGQLPGGGGGGSSGGLGLKPFTNLRGFLDQGSNRELFRVRGLGDQARYMRMITLPVYNPNGGWELPDPMPPGMSTKGSLPQPPGDNTAGEVVRIDIEAIEHKDLFAPVYGTPERMQGLPAAMRYDAVSGMVYNQTHRKLPRFVLETDMSQPSAEDLRQAGTDYTALDLVYLASRDIDQQVVDLAADITAGQPTPYDKAVALATYFDGNGYSYQLETATGNDEDALVDFLIHSKTGFCEQYASAMAILARAAGLPSRVAMGYTAGFQSNDYRSITTKDAHAWVEIFFPGQGWQLFDPTPLTDGRTYTPPYAAPSSGADSSDDPTSQDQQPRASADTTAPLNNRENDPEAGATPGSGAQQQDQSTPWIWWAAAVAAVLATLLTVLGLRAGRARGLVTVRLHRVLIRLAVACWTLAAVLLVGAWSWWISALLVVLVAASAPGLVRNVRRRNHRHAVVAHRPSAPSAAWAELLAESVDRGAELADTETVRSTARRLAREHGLDEDGKRALRTVVTAVERSWYGGRSEPDPALAAAFDDVVAGLRRIAPLGLRERLLPRSVLQRRPRQSADQAIYPVG
jgi:transglutaminase-like putative cysteine protease